MPANQCHGLARGPGPDGHRPLSRCTYDAMPDDDYCFVHRKVADGHISDMSWRPVRPRHAPKSKDEEEWEAIERLRVEWVA